MKNLAIEAARHVLEANYKATGDALHAFPGASSGPMGLTPDTVKASPDYQAKKAECARAFAALRRFNTENPPQRGPRYLRKTP